jgi:hypothetical protein
MATYNEEAVGRDKIFDFMQQLMDDIKNGNFDEGLVFVTRKITDERGRTNIQVQSVNNLSHDNDTNIALYGSIVKSCMDILNRKGLAQLVNTNDFQEVPHAKKTF